MTDVDKLLAVIDNLQQCAEEAAPGSKQHHLLKESLSKLHDMELSQSHLASLRDLASGHRSTPDDGKKLVQLIHNIHKRKKHLGADEKKYEERQFLDSSLSTLYGTDIYKEFLGSSYEKSHENLFCDTERVLKLKSDLEALKRLLNRESESWSKCQQIIDDSMATLSSTDVYKSKVESLPGVASSDFKTFCEMIEKLRNRRDEEREKMEKQSEDEGAEREHDESRPFFDDSIAILYDMTACRSYLASLSDNSLAYISSDIIHDLVAPVEDHTLLKNLAETTGNWGSVAQRRDSFLKNHVRELSMQIRCEGEREIMHEQLPKCYGKLALFDLCRWLDDAEAQKMIEESQDAYFSDLCLHWHYHVGESVPVPAEFKNFILKHLKSKYLKRLDIRTFEDLQLDDQLLNFCLSDQFEYLKWHRVLPASFFMDVLNGFKECTIRRPRMIEGYVNKETFRVLVRSLGLKKTSVKGRYSEYKAFWTVEDSSNLTGYSAQLYVLNYGYGRCMVHIILRETNQEEIKQAIKGTFDLSSDLDTVCETGKLSYTEEADDEGSADVDESSTKKRKEEAPSDEEEESAESMEDVQLVDDEDEMNDDADDNEEYSIEEYPRSSDSLSDEFDVKCSGKNFPYWTYEALDEFIRPDDHPNDCKCKYCRCDECGRALDMYQDWGGDGPRCESCEEYEKSPICPSCNCHCNCYDY